MIKSMAVTVIQDNAENARAEADELFTTVWGAGAYAVGGVEVTPFDLSDPYTEIEQLPDPTNPGELINVQTTKRDTISWSCTFAAHPVS